MRTPSPRGALGRLRAGRRSLLSTTAQQQLARTVVSLLTVLVVLDFADRAALGAVAPALQVDLGLNLADLGLLGAAFGLVGGGMTLLAGVLVDRVPRMRLLAVSALTWSAAMLATGAAQTLLWLLLARAALAVVLATVGPSYPSLVGDSLPPPSRARALGIIDGGQLVGGALGLVVGGACVALLSWRWAFWLLALPALLVAPRLWRCAEPPRQGSPDQQVGLAVVARRLRHTPTAVRVMIATTVGNYYLAGASAFSTLFTVARYHVSTATADFALVALGAGAVAGIALGSVTSDRLESNGTGQRRLSLAAVGYVLTALFWLPALLVHSLAAALPFLIVGSAALAATIPALDAVRIDVIPPAMRGRTEAVRTLFRALAEGGAPLAFGVVAAAHGGNNAGLQLAFLITLPGLLAAAVILVTATPSYNQDRQPIAEQEAQHAAQVRSTGSPHRPHP